MARISTFEGYYPAVAIDGSNNLHLVWEAKVSDGNYYGIFYARQSNATKKWSAPKRIATARYAEVPDIAAKRGRIVVVFQSRADDAHYQLNIVESVDGGKTWSE